MSVHDGVAIVHQREQEQISLTSGTMLPVLTG
jgi:hypothetical protein